MSNLQIMSNQDFGEVRFIKVGNKIYTVGSDVAKALGYNQPHKAIARHCKGGIKHTIPTNGGNQEMTIIPEGDVFRLITHSKLPAAEKFESWVFDEVLPEIRKTGGYIEKQPAQHLDNRPCRSTTQPNAAIKDQVVYVKKAIQALDIALDVYNFPNTINDQKSMEKALLLISVKICGEVTKILTLSRVIDETEAI